MIKDTAQTPDADRAVSNVVAVALLIAITVFIATIAGYAAIGIVEDSTTDGSNVPGVESNETESSDNADREGGEVRRSANQSRSDGTNTAASRYYVSTYTCGSTEGANRIARRNGMTANNTTTLSGKYATSIRILNPTDDDVQFTVSVDGHSSERTVGMAETFEVTCSDISDLKSDDDRIQSGIVSLTSDEPLDVFAVHTVGGRRSISDVIIERITAEGG